jgi:hypothetical protein
MALRAVETGSANGSFVYITRWLKVVEDVRRVAPEAGWRVNLSPAAAG